MEGFPGFESPCNSDSEARRCVLLAMMRADAQQILADEALARRLAEEEVLQVDSDSPRRPKRKRPEPSADLDPLLMRHGSWAEEQMSSSARLELEEMRLGKQSKGHACGETA